MKKIIFKSGSTMLGGLEKVQVEYINYLLENDYDIKVIIENDNGPDNKLEKDIKSEVIYLKDYSYIKKIKKLRKNKTKSLFSKIKYNYALSKEKKYSEKLFLDIYTEFKPDVVIDFDSSLTRTIQKLKNSKNILWIHSSVKNWKKKKSRIKNYVKRIESYNKIICISKEMMNDLKNLNKNLEKKSNYIYNPINKENIIELSKEQFLLEELELSKEKYILMVSRLDTVPKDFETLIKGFEIAKNNNYSGSLYILGDGPDKSKVENLIKESKYSKEIKILGSKINPYNWMKNAEKLILSSKYEGLPTVLLEGLVLKKECISSNCKTGPKEILDKERGYLFEVGDFEALGKYILQTKIKPISDEEFKEFSSENNYKKLKCILEE
ncbi:MAG: glycosyltransferase [Fusobacteriaceae bacterium]